VSRTREDQWEGRGSYDYDPYAEHRRQMSEGSLGLTDRRAEGPHRGRGPKNYHRSDDRVREDVSERLSDDGNVDASDIEVSVEEGIVTLSGTVSTRREKRLAEDCCEGVPGVKDVSNQLRVHRQSEGEGSSKDQQRTGSASHSTHKT
jgi:osmotically-inducible protein OsmY